VLVAQNWLFRETTNFST